MFGCNSLGSRSTSSSPLLAAMQGPHERGLCQESGYLCRICERLVEEHPEGCAQAQLTAEACQQKWYYDRKVGTCEFEAWQPGISEGGCLEGKEED